MLRKGAYCWRVPSLKGHATLKIQVVARALAGAAGKLVNTATLTGPSEAAEGDGGRDAGEAAPGP